MNASTSFVPIAEVEAPNGFAPLDPLPARVDGPSTSFVDRVLGLFRGDGDHFEQSRRLLARSDVLTELSPPGASRRLMFLVSLLVLGSAVWASIVELDEVASAPGEIAPLAQVQPVQHLEGGIVASINAIDGQRVRKGDVLVTMSGAAVDADLARARAHRTALLLRTERLIAFSDGRAPSFSADPTGELRDGAAAILQVQMQSRDAQLSVADSQSAGRRGEAAALSSHAVSLRQQIELMQREMAARKPLVDKGLNSPLSYLALQRELTRLQGDLAETAGSRQRALAAIQEAGRNRTEINERLRADAMTQYGETSAQLAEVEQEVKRLEDQSARLNVRSPIDGVVKGLAAISVRQVIPAGGVIADVVPQTGPMVANVRLSPGDIGHVKVGSLVMVKVVTYDFARNGGIAGAIDYVSAASFVDHEGHSFFKARVKLSSDHVGPASRSFVVSPGMTVVADVKTGSKTLTEYLFRPVTNSLNGAFGER
jgi:HlyD family secretion protein/adhesin transport system membrane fusion protein